MKRILGATAGVLVSLSAAQAADVEPSYTEHDWSGPYIGLQAGYGWGESDASFEFGDSEDAAASQPIILFPIEEGSIDADGFVGGIHAGYNLQADRLVIGIEGDVEASDVDGVPTFCLRKETRLSPRRRRSMTGSLRSDCAPAMRWTACSSTRRAAWPLPASTCHSMFPKRISMNPIRKPPSASRSGAESNLLSPTI